MRGRNWEKYRCCLVTHAARFRSLPPELRRSLASTNIIESMNSVIRQVCRNVKRWRDAKMALRWTAAGMFEAKKDLCITILDSFNLRDLILF